MRRRSAPATCASRRRTGGDAGHILKLLLENRFPRLWRPDAAQRDLRQLLIHRHKLVGIRARVKNGLQHLMLDRGVQMKRKLWSQAGQQALCELPLEGWAATRSAAVAEGFRWTHSPAG
jgi:hypothetical protein